jgi:hypothetical protein
MGQQPGLRHLEAKANCRTITCMLPHMNVYNLASRWRPRSTRSTRRRSRTPAPAAATEALADRPAVAPTGEGPGLTGAPAPAAARCRQGRSRPRTPTATTPTLERTESHRHLRAEADQPAADRRIRCPPSPPWRLRRPNADARLAAEQAGTVPATSVGPGGRAHQDAPGLAGRPAHECGRVKPNPRPGSSPPTTSSSTSAEAASSAHRPTAPAGEADQVGAKRRERGGVTDRHQTRAGP